MLVLTGCGFSSASFLSLSLLNQRPSLSHPHAFLPSPPPTLFSVQKSFSYTIHRYRYFPHIVAAAVKWPANVNCGNAPVSLSSGKRGEGEEENYLAKTKTSGTSARGRRLLRVREDKRKREYDRIHNYPTWAKILENACKDDEELRAVLGDSVGNPELMRKRVEERVRTKGRDFRKPKTGSVLSFKVSFRE